MQGDTCVLCRASIGTEDMFYEHSRVHSTDSSTIQCIICRQTLTSLLELQAHGTFHYSTTPPAVKPQICYLCKRPCENEGKTAIAQLPDANQIPVCSACFDSMPRAQERHADTPATKPRCAECGVKFETAEELKAHEPVHKRSLYQCIKCQESFASEDEIKLHVITHVVKEGTVHVCRLCLQVFDSPAKLQCHLIEHTYAGCAGFTCPICNTVFTTSTAIQTHVFEHTTAPKPFQCNKCPQKFFFRSEMENHVLEHTYQSAQYGTVSPSNNFCSSSAAQPANDDNAASHLIQVLQQVSPAVQNSRGSSNGGVGGAVFPERPGSKSAMMQSDRSGIKRTSLDRLNSKDGATAEYQPRLRPSSRDSVASDSRRSPHAKAPLTTLIPINIKSEDSITDVIVKKELECPDCGKTFANENSIENHMKIHRSGCKSFKCSLCTEEFSKSSDMQQHFFLRHSMTELRPKKQKYACTECGKEFPCLSNLQGHLKIHTHGKSFKCPICKKEFALARNLTIHLRMHSGEKPYECPICKKCFARKENRKTHMKSHAGHRPFMCPQCGKMFARKSHVKGHIQSHFRDSVRRCETCHSQFPDTNSLWEHMRKSHNLAIEAVCHICNEIFTLKKNFRRHLKKMHGLNSKFPSMSQVDGLSCPTCCDVFYSRKALECHIRQAHNKPNQSASREPSPSEVCSSDCSNEIDEHLDTSTIDTSTCSDDVDSIDTTSSAGVSSNGMSSSDKMNGIAFLMPEKISGDGEDQKQTTVIVNDT